MGFQSVAQQFSYNILPSNNIIASRGNGMYIPPALMPGYTGHVPGNRFLCGYTFGNSTKKYFQDCRNAALSCSTSPYSRGVMFPSKNRDRTVRMLHWTTPNVDFDRQGTIKNFDQFYQMHREKYLDKTGTRWAVEHFNIPMNL